MQLQFFILPIMFLGIGMTVAYFVDILFFEEDRTEFLKLNCNSYPDNCNNVVIDFHYLPFIIMILFVIFGIMINQAVKQLV